MAVTSVDGAVTSADGAACCKGGQAKQRNPAHVPAPPFKQYHADSVPRRARRESEVAIGQEVTTVMLRNIPNRYSQQSLLDELDSVGFGGSYDFFYLPMDVHNRMNVGYAFVNLITPQDAQLFYEAFSRYSFRANRSKKIACVCPAHVQGLVGNLYQLEKRAVTHSKESTYRPIVFVGGQRRDFLDVLADLNFCRRRGEASVQTSRRNSAEPKRRESERLTLCLASAVGPLGDEGLRLADSDEAEDVPARDTAAGRPDGRHGAEAAGAIGPVGLPLRPPSTVPPVTLQDPRSTTALPLRWAAGDASGGCEARGFARSAGAGSCTTELFCPGAGAQELHAVVRRTFLNFETQNDTPLRRRAHSLGM